MAYLGKTPSQAVRSRYYFTASGGETSLSGTDDNSNTLTYTDGNYVDVSLNGVALVAGSDYNTTTANTIGGLTALTASDVVEIVVYDTFSVFSGAFTGDISLGDNVKAKFGASDDLQIYHDGSNSYISEQGTGNLFIQADAGIVIESASTGENYIAASANGAVTLFYDNASKLATTSSGIDVTGTVTADGILNNNKSEFFASEAALVSTGSTAKVYATNSTFDGVNGSLVLQSRPTSGADVYIATGSTPKTVAKFNDGGDIAFYDSTGVTQGLFWDASTQRLGVGTTTPAQPLEISGTAPIIRLTDTGASNNYSEINADYTSGSLQISADTANASSNSRIMFAVDNTERMRIDSSGNVGVGTTPSGARLDINTSANEIGTDILCESASQTSDVFRISASRNTTDNTYFLMRASCEGVADRFQIRDSGNVKNANNSYGAISDERMKENIVDANSQWDDIKALQLRNYNMIGEDVTQIGVIAQELEAAGMNGLVEEGDFFHATANPDGETRKSVKYSVLYMKAIGALQEAIAKIETLEASNADLIARIETLENA